LSLGYSSYFFYEADSFDIPIIARHNWQEGCKLPVM